MSVITYLIWLLLALMHVTLGFWPGRLCLRLMSKSMTPVVDMFAIYPTSILVHISFSNIVLSFGNSASQWSSIIMSSTSVATVLPVGVGYGVVVGIGFFFASLMCCLSWVQVSTQSYVVLAGNWQSQNRYTKYSTKTSEEFNTASRSVKPGLIASGIVSAWTWAATLLQSSTVAYEYGIAGPFWVGKHFHRLRTSD